MMNIKRKNRKIKYNEENYINLNYMVNGKAVIPVELETVDDLFMKHDYKQFELSDDVCKYIEEIAYMIPISTDIVIELHCPEVDDVFKEKMIRAIRNNYGMEIDDIDYENRMSGYISAILFIVGIVIFIIAYALEGKILKIIDEFLFILGWFIIWDMLESIIFTSNERNIKRLNKLQLYDSKVEFIFDK